MRATGFNHVSIHARNLEESVRFYVDVLGMETIPTYNFAFPVQYLRLGDLRRARAGRLRASKIASFCSRRLLTELSSALRVRL